MGSELIGRIELADKQGFCCVVLNREPVEQAGSARLPRPSDEVFAALKEASHEGSLYTTGIVAHEDGSVFLKDRRITIED